MSLLLDAHALLGALVELEKLSGTAREIIEDPQNIVVVSAVSAWEVTIKYGLGRLPEAQTALDGFQYRVPMLPVVELAVNSTHAITAGSLKSRHRDPIDGRLVAQSRVEG